MPADRVLDVIRGAGGALLRGAEVFDVYRGAQVGEGRASLAVRLEFRAPDRTLTDEEVAQRREKIVAALREQVGGRAAWLAPSSRARRQRVRGRDRRDARAPPPVLRARARDGARARPARGSTTSTRARACRSSSSRGTRTRSPTSTPRSSAGRIASPRRPWPRCASAACASSTCRPTSGCATAASTRTGTARTARPSCSAQGVYGLPELHRERIAGADLVANPGCYPTAALLALAPLARAGLLGDVVIDAKSGVSGAGREPTPTTHFISADENMTPYKVERHRHTPEIEQELAGQGAPLTSRSRRTCVPLAQGELVSCYVTPARERRRPSCRASTTTRTRASRGSSCARPARRAGGARHQLLPHLGPPRRRGAAGSSCSPRSTTCGRAPPRRPCRT